ncbi:MAG TPA: hypothetical protein ENJ82_15950, partial [Bacteroidetes bacterium]|nr:hypothetical protein [Bacteroidota bacterium]
MNKTLILALLIMTISGCTPRLTGVGTPTPCKLKVEHYTLKKGKRIQVSTQTFDINDSLLSDEHGNQGTYNKYDAQGRLVQRLTTENGDT